MITTEHERPSPTDSLKALLSARMQTMSSTVQDLVTPAPGGEPRSPEARRSSSSSHTMFTSMKQPDSTTGGLPRRSSCPVVANMATMHQQLTQVDTLNRKVLQKEISLSQALTSLARVQVPGKDTTSGYDCTGASTTNADVVSLSNLDNVQKHSKHTSPTPAHRRGPPPPPPRRNSEIVGMSSGQVGVSCMAPEACETATLQSNARKDSCDEDMVTRTCASVTSAAQSPEVQCSKLKLARSQEQSIECASHDALKETVPCNRCEVAKQQVLALLQCLNGLGASVVNWSAGHNVFQRKDLVSLVLEYLRPCAHLDSDLKTLCSTLDTIRWDEPINSTSDQHGEDGKTVALDDNARCEQDQDMIDTGGVSASSIEEHCDIDDAQNEEDACGSDVVRQRCSGFNGSNVDSDKQQEPLEQSLEINAESLALAPSASSKSLASSHGDRMDSIKDTNEYIELVRSADENLAREATQSHLENEMICHIAGCKIKEISLDSDSPSFGPDIIAGDDTAAFTQMSNCEAAGPISNLRIPSQEEAVPSARRKTFIPDVEPDEEPAAEIGSHVQAKAPVPTQSVGAAQSSKQQNFLWQASLAADATRLPCLPALPVQAMAPSKHCIQELVNIADMVSCSSEFNPDVDSCGSEAEEQFLRACAITSLAGMQGPSALEALPAPHVPRCSVTASERESPPPPNDAHDSPTPNIHVFESCGDMVSSKGSACDIVMQSTTPSFCSFPTPENHTAVYSELDLHSSVVEPSVEEVGPTCSDRDVASPYDTSNSLSFKLSYLEAGVDNATAAESSCDAAVPASPSPTSSDVPAVQSVFEYSPSPENVQETDCNEHQTSDTDDAVDGIFKELSGEQDDDCHAKEIVARSSLPLGLKSHSQSDSSADTNPILQNDNQKHAGSTSNFEFEGLTIELKSCASGLGPDSSTSKHLKRSSDAPAEPEIAGCPSRSFAFEVEELSETNSLLSYASSPRSATACCELNPSVVERKSDVPLPGAVALEPNKQVLATRLEAIAQRSLRYKREGTTEAPRLELVSAGASIEHESSEGYLKQEPREKVSCAFADLVESSRKRPTMPQGHTVSKHVNSDGDGIGDCHDINKANGMVPPLPGRIYLSTKASPDSLCKPLPSHNFESSAGTQCQGLSVSNQCEAGVLGDGSASSTPPVVKERLNGFNPRQNGLRPGCIFLNRADGHTA